LPSSVILDEVAREEGAECVIDPPHFEHMVSPYQVLVSNENARRNKTAPPPCGAFLAIKKGTPLNASDMRGITRRCSLLIF
jgi:hypothetical protein